MNVYFAKELAVCGAVPVDEHPPICDRRALCNGTTRIIRTS